MYHKFQIKKHSIEQGQMLQTIYIVTTGMTTQYEQYLMEGGVNSEA